MPFGQDRLIPIWVATLAVRQRSLIVRFHRASEMLAFFHLFKDGKRYHRIMEGFQRILAATIFFGCNLLGGNLGAGLDGDQPGMIGLCR